MKWYFALSGSSIDRPGHDWRDMIRVAVLSAFTRTSLIPVMLYDGEESAFTDELRGLGVQIIHRRVSFFDRLARHGGTDALYLAVASGAFLRFDICQVEADPYVLYTDCDVIFEREPDFMAASQPTFFSATSQSSHNPAEDMNSGVMLINTQSMRQEYDALVAFTCDNLQLGFDQEILRVFYGNRYMAMDRSLNWKPYWGFNPKGQIVHFHGPKPGPARQMQEGTDTTAPDLWKAIYNQSPLGYAHYVDQFEALLRSYRQFASERKASLSLAV